MGHCVGNHRAVGPCVLCHVAAGPMGPGGTADVGRGLVPVIPLCAPYICIASGKLPA